MGFVAQNLGKYMSVDENSPEAAGVCDITGFVFPHSQLVKQMDWRGNSLEWTGLMVGAPFVDRPQPQNRPPPVQDDPTVVKNPRLPKDYIGLVGNDKTYQQIFRELNNISFSKP